MNLLPILPVFYNFYSFTGRIFDWLNSLLWRENTTGASRYHIHSVTGKNTKIITGNRRYRILSKTLIGWKRVLCEIGSVLKLLQSCQVVLVLSCLVLCSLFALVSCEIVCMDLSDVERLDGVLAEGKRWHGCLLCKGEGEEVPYNLLVEGPVVKFYKSKTGNTQSRQATNGIMIPTAVPATVEEWPHVLIQLQQWAFEGNSPISCLLDRGANRQCLLDKILQCPRGVMYRPRVPQQFDCNGLREGMRINGIRQHHNHKTIQIQKRNKAQCEATIRPTKRVHCPHTQRSMSDVKLNSLRKTRSLTYSPVYITLISIDLFMSL